MAEPVCFHLDPRCPWCWQTSKWVRQLHRLGVVEASWGVFCLEVVNFKKPLEEFDVSRSIAAPGLRTFVMTRDVEGQDAASRFYEALGHRYFELEQPLEQPDTVRGALVDAGLDPVLHDKAVTDAWTWKTVMEEHHSLVRDTRSFGVPTIRLDGGYGPAIFGPVISNPPSSDEEAVEMWTHVAWLTRNENFSELKRDRTIDPDLGYWRTAQAKRRAEAAAIADTQARADVTLAAEAAARATGARLELNAMRLEPLDALDRAQTSAAVAIARIGEGDWSRPTPCDTWSVRDVVNKMVASTITFTCFGRRTRPEPPLDLIDPVEMLGEDPLGRYLAAAVDCRDAWRAPGALEGTAPSTIGDFPAKAVLNARIFDTTILTWDVTTACGVPHGIDEDLAAYVLRVARALVPTVRAARPQRYKEAADADETATTVVQMIATTGRNPHWTPAPPA